MKNMAVPPPKYYDKLLERENPQELLKIKSRRTKNCKPKENTYDRLKIRKLCKEAQINSLKRIL